MTNPTMSQNEENEEEENNPPEEVPLENDPILLQGADVTVLCRNGK